MVKNLAMLPLVTWNPEHAPKEVGDPAEGVQAVLECPYWEIVGWILAKELWMSALLDFRIALDPGLLQTSCFPAL